MNARIKLLWSLFLCTLGLQATITLAKAHSEESAEAAAVPDTALPGQQSQFSKSQWQDSRLLELRNAFEEKLLSASEEKKGMRRAFINKFVGSTIAGKKLTEKEAKTVVEMMEERLKFIQAEVDLELRAQHSTTSKMRFFDRNPVKGRRYKHLPIGIGEWGPVSAYEIKVLRKRFGVPPRDLI